MSNHSLETCADKVMESLLTERHPIDMLADQRDALADENRELRAEVTRLRKELRAANRGAQVNSLINRQLVDRIYTAIKALEPGPVRRPNKYGYWNDYP